MNIAAGMERQDFFSFKSFGSKLLLQLIVFFNALLLQSQTSEVWFGYITSARISEHSAIWNDVHYVGTSFLALRTGYTYFLHQNLDVTAGYAHVITATPFSTRLIRPEDRPWGQVVWRYFPNEKIRLRSRFRYDARFRRVITASMVTDEVALTHRMRLMQDVRFKLLNFGNGRKLHLNIIYEGLFNAASGIRSQTDQHRFYFLPGYQVGSFNLMLGVHLRAIHSSSGNINFRYGMCFWLTHIFDMRRKTKTYKTDETD
jgi:hypothetical protein